MRPIAASEFEESVLRDPGPLAIVYFWGYQCPNCEVFQRHWPEVERELAGLPLQWFKINAYDETALATRFGLYGVPSFLFFSRGKLLGRVSSFPGTDFLVTVIREQLQKLGSNPA